MCRQADYSQRDCVLFSDKCSAIKEFCVTRRSAICKRLPRRRRMPTGYLEARKRRTGPTRAYPALLDPDCWNAAPQARAPCTVAAEDKKGFLRSARTSRAPEGPSPAGTNWCQVSVSRRIKRVCFTFTSGAEGKTASTPG